METGKRTRLFHGLMITNARMGEEVVMDKSQDTQRRIHDSIMAEIDSIYEKVTEHENLKPCPFCGGEAVIGDGGYSGEKFFVRCRESNCPAAFGTIRKTYDEAVAVWNHRALMTMSAENHSEEEVAKFLCDDCIYDDNSCCGYDSDDPDDYCFNGNKRVRR